MSDSDRSSQLRLSEQSRHLMSTKELILQMRKQPCLWDRTSPQYRERDTKEKAWKQICEYFYPDFDTLKKSNQLEIGHLITKKWYNVRDAYKKSIKPGSRAASRPYVYANLLTFLNYSNATKPDKSPNEVDDDREEVDKWVNQVFVDIDNEDVDETPNLEQPKVKYEYTGDNNETTEEGHVDDNIVSVLAGLIRKEEDEDRAFFKSITPAVKRLPESAKFTFRIQVMKLLNNLKVHGRLVGPSRRTTAMDTDSE